MRNAKLAKITVFMPLVALAVVVLPWRIPHEAISANIEMEPAHSVAKSPSITIEEIKRRIEALEGKTTPLLPVVDQEDIRPHHQLLADTVLRTIPSLCRTHLKNFYVQYDDPEKRGLGGGSTIIIYGGVDDEEFVGLLIHECGHVMHSHLMGTPESGQSSFKDGTKAIYNNGPIADFFSISWSNDTTKKTTTKNADFVSGYARSNPFEEFSETLTMYVLHRSALIEQAKNNAAIASKLLWMQQHLPMQDSALMRSAHAWSGVIPWDSTRLEGSLLSGVVIP